MISTRLPGLFRKEYQTILGSMRADTANLTQELVRLLSDYQIWWSKWNPSLDLGLEDMDPFDPQLLSRLDTLVTFFEHFAITCRLVTAMMPKSYPELETYTLNSAERTLSLTRKSSGLDTVKQAHLRLACVVAKAVVSTSPKWSHQIQVDEQSLMIFSETFFEWCNLIGCKLGD